MDQANTNMFHIHPDLGMIRNRNDIEIQLMHMGHYHVIYIDTFRIRSHLSHNLIKNEYVTFSNNPKSHITLPR